jgi:hypothetical protein
MAVQLLHMPQGRRGELEEPASAGASARGAKGEESSKTRCWCPGCSRIGWRGRRRPCRCRDHLVHGPRRGHHPIQPAHGVAGPPRRDRAQPPIACGRARQIGGLSPQIADSKHEPVIAGLSSTTCDDSETAARPGPAKTPNAASIDIPSRQNNKQPMGEGGRPRRCAIAPPPRSGILVGIIMALIGCSAEGILRPAAESPEGQFAQRTVESLVAGRVEDVRSSLTGGSASADVDKKLAALAAIYSGHAVAPPKLIRFRMEQDANGQRAHAFLFDSAYDDGHVLTTVIIRSKGEGEHAMELNAQKLTKADEEANSFSLKRAGPIHYAFLLAALANPCLIVLALVRWVRTRRDLRKKWLWLPAIVLGLGGIGLQWTTGRIVELQFSVQPFGVSFTRTPYEPWMLYISLPLGAILFLRRRKPRAPIAEPAGQELSQPSARSAGDPPQTRELPPSGDVSTDDPRPRARTRGGASEEGSDPNRVRSSAARP